MFSERGENGRIGRVLAALNPVENRIHKAHVVVDHDPYPFLNQVRALTSYQCIQIEKQATMITEPALKSEKRIRIFHLISVQNFASFKDFTRAM